MWISIIGWIVLGMSCWIVVGLVIGLLLGTVMYECGDGAASAPRPNLGDPASDVAEPSVILRRRRLGRRDSKDRSRRAAIARSN